MTIDTTTKSAILYGGTVLTLDGDPGDFAKADVSVEGARIAAVAPDMPVTGARSYPAYPSP
jgi:hypothetical protein